jgi:hypothetical protein
MTPDHPDPINPRGPLTPSVLCLFGLLAILLAGAIAWGVASGQESTDAPAGPVYPSPQAPHVRAPLPRPAYLPDPKLTPGVVLITDRNAICQSGYAKRARAVSESAKRDVFKRYGITVHRSGEYEVDHLVSLELGGSNTSDPKSPDYLKNLFPEPYSLVIDGRQMGAREKDRAEDATHRAVCAGKIGLKEAQKQIAADWTVLYRRFVAPEFPKASPEVKAGLRLRPRTRHSLIADIDSGICSDPERHVEEAVRELVGRKASLGDEVNP